jgi:hypothetical protein
MERSFTLTREQVVSADPATLEASILAATGGERGANSIMRSLERMGTDPSIEYFEMTEVPGSRRFGGAVPSAWRVRADRGVTEEPGLTEEPGR